MTRQYHSTALLLPDGRVLSSGGGICGTCDAVGYLAKNAQVFTPPYLFKTDGSGELAARPEIAAAPAMRTTAAVPDRHAAGRVDRQGRAGPARRRHALGEHGAALRAALLHGRGRLLTATAPANANVAPPGVYMLFVIDADGVPSVAKMVDASSATSRRREPDAAGRRRHVHRAGDDQRRGERVRRRRHASPRSSSSTARPSSARTPALRSPTPGPARRGQPTRSPRARPTTSARRRRAAPRTITVARTARRA